MSRPLLLNPSKANIYCRRWRAKNPKPPSAKKLEMERVRSLLGLTLGAQLGRKELYRERRRERSRWDAVYEAAHDKMFGTKLYSYADAVFKRQQALEDKQRRRATPQSMYMRNYRAKRKAEMPESVAVPRILEHLPEHMHGELLSLLDAVRRCPKPVPEPIQAPVPEAGTLTTIEQRHQAVLEAGHDLTFDGVVFYHEDALWQESRK